MWPPLSEFLPSLKEVLWLESDFWTQEQVISGSSSIHWKTKEEIVQLDLQIKRYNEVVTLLTSDMLATGGIK